MADTPLGTPQTERLKGVGHMEVKTGSNRDVRKGTLGKPRKALPPRVDVIELHPVCAKGTLRAFASVTLAGQLVIRDLRLVKEGEKQVVSMPIATWVDRDGQTRRRPLIVLPTLWSTAITTAVVAAWNSLGGVASQDEAEKGGVA